MQDTFQMDDDCDYQLSTHNVPMLTWISSLAIMVLCAAAFLKLFFVPAKVPSSSDTCIICGSKFEEYLVPALFLSMANTYGIIGIFHYERTTTTTKNSIHDTEIMERLLSIVPLVTSFLAVLLGLTMTGAMPTSKVVTKRALFWVCLMSFFGLALISVVANVHLPFYVDLDLHTVVSVGGLLVLWTFYLSKALREKDGRMHSIIKASSVMVFVISFGYESIFYTNCDSFEAYENCFRDCPLPTRGNTNSYINLVVLIATISWSFSENSVPSIQKPKRLVWIAPTVALCDDDDSASIDTIEDFHNLIPVSDAAKSDIEAGAKSRTEVEHSSFDQDAVDTVSAEGASMEGSTSKLAVVDEDKEGH